MRPPEECILLHHQVQVLSLDAGRSRKAVKRQGAAGSLGDLRERILYSVAEKVGAKAQPT